MRIALTVAHATGKSTLVAELARALPDHRVIDAPYHQVYAEGHAFAAARTLEDLEVAKVLVCLATRQRAGDRRGAR